MSLMKNQNAFLLFSLLYPCRHGWCRPVYIADGSTSFSYVTRIPYFPGNQQRGSPTFFVIHSRPLFTGRLRCRMPRLPWVRARHVRVPGPMGCAVFPCPSGPGGDLLHSILHIIHHISDDAGALVPLSPEGRSTPVAEVPGILLCGPASREPCGRLLLFLGALSCGASIGIISSAGSGHTDNSSQHNAKSDPSDLFHNKKSPFSFCPKQATKGKENDVSADHIGHVVHARSFSCQEFGSLDCALGKDGLGIRGVIEGDHLVLCRRKSRRARPQWCRRGRPGCRSPSGRASPARQLAVVLIMVYRLPWLSLMESARARAVPLGASTFWLWCFSRISISKPASANTGAACL